VPAPVIDRQCCRSRADLLRQQRPGHREARDLLRAAGVASSYLRLRALPLESSLTEFVSSHKRLYVVENNLDGQMRALIQLHAPADADRLVSITRCDGLPLTADWIAASITALEAKEEKP